MKRIFVLTLAVLLLAPFSIFAQEPRLSGKWQMSFDPDGPVVNDWMVFQNNGKVNFGDDQGVYISCHYRAQNDNVTTTCIVRGQKKTMQFEVRNEFQDLVNPSGAIYTKQ